MNQIKIGTFMKELRKEKGLYKNNLTEAEELFQDGKQEAIF